MYRYYGLKTDLKIINNQLNTYVNLVSEVLLIYNEVRNNNLVYINIYIKNRF